MALFNDFRYRLRSAGDGMFLHQHDTAVLVLSPPLTDSSLQLLLQRCTLRDDGRLGTGSYRGVKRQETGVAAHDLYQEQPLMARTGVAQLVHTLHDRIQRRVIADSRIGAP